jgi:phosphoglycerate dehydrogenase-like enzyme
MTIARAAKVSGRGRSFLRARVQIVRESNSVRGGGWQVSIGRELDGKVLGVLGLGNVGGEVARIGHAFGMKVIASSQNTTPQIAEAAGASLVTKEELYVRPMW